MIRLNAIVEGQTEETFVRNVIRPQLQIFDIDTHASCVVTRRTPNMVYRGGGCTYGRIRKQVAHWMRHDPAAWTTTMFDLFRLSPDFPDYEDAKRVGDAYQRVSLLEAAFEKDIVTDDCWRFVPYIQLHEYETLLFSDVAKFLPWVDSADQIEELRKVAALHDSPEQINDGPETAPSKRIISVFPRYASQKAVVGPIVAEKIGLADIRRQCCHFNEWLTRLEGLND